MTLETLFLENPLSKWLIALGVGAGALLLLLTIRRVLVGRLKAFAERTATDWDDILASALGRTRLLFLVIVSAQAGAMALELPDRVSGVLRVLMVLAAAMQAGIWASVVLVSLLERYRREKMEEDRGAASMIGAMSFLIRLLLWAVILLLALDNLGIDITAMVAGLGVGGIAVALAVQNILGDLFASLAIIMDKPFVLGDFIVVGDLRGSVEHIGLKTTRVRSIGGEQIIFSNADLLSSRLHNFGRLQERRAVLVLGVTYQTPREKLQRIPTILREAVETQDGARFDRSHFDTYGDFSLNFETVFYVLSNDYVRFMDIKQAVLFEIHARFEAEGIEFAYPSQTLFLARA
ncbi:MAG: mechanosensitive ion channel family protein [Gemmatimonadales bacterium]